MKTARYQRRQAGSAFVVVLMVLVVLTFIGLGLSLMTESEVTIGWNERVSTRMLYGADSGIAIAVGRYEGAAECSELDVDTAQAMNGSEEAVIRISPYLPINDGPCALCDINVSDASSGYQKLYRRINYLVGAEAVRSDAIQPGQFGYASHVVSAMVDVQPYENAMRDCHAIATAPNSRKIPAG